MKIQELLQKSNTISNLFAKTLEKLSRRPVRSTNKLDIRVSTTPKRPVDLSLDKIPNKPIFSNHDFYNLMRLMSSSHPELKELERLAAKRFTINTDGVVQTNDLYNYRNALRGKANTKGVTVFDALLSLIKTGELEKIFTEGSTQVTREALSRKMKRSGVSEHAVGDKVTAIDTGKQGVVVDLNPENGNYFVAMSPFETIQLPANKIQRVGITRVAKHVSSQDEIKSAVPQIKRNAAPVMTRNLQDHGIRKMEAFFNRFKLPGVLRLTFCGFKQPEYGKTGALEKGYMNFLAEIGTPLGAKVRFDVPMRVEGDQFYDPSIFFYNKQMQMFTQANLDKVFSMLELNKPTTTNLFGKNPTLMDMPLMKPSEFAPGQARPVERLDYHIAKRTK